MTVAIPQERLPMSLQSEGLKNNVFQFKSPRDEMRHSMLKVEQSINR